MGEIERGKKILVLSVLKSCWLWGRYSDLMGLRVFMGKIKSGARLSQTSTPLLKCLDSHTLLGDGKIWKVGGAKSLLGKIKKR